MTEIVKKEVKHHVVEEMDVKELEPVDVVTKNKKETNKEVKVDKPDAFKNKINKTEIEFYFSFIFQHIYKI